MSNTPADKNLASILWDHVLPKPAEVILPRVSPVVTTLPTEVPVAENLVMLSSEQPSEINASQTVDFFKIGDVMPPVLFNSILDISPMPGQILVYTFWNARMSESSGMMDVIELILRKKEWESIMKVVAVEIEFTGPMSETILVDGDETRKTDAQIFKILEFNKWDNMTHLRADTSSYAIFQRFPEFTTLKAPFMVVIDQKGLIQQMGLPDSMQQIELILARQVMIVNVAAALKRDL